MLFLVGTLSVVITCCLSCGVSGVPLALASSVFDVVVAAETEETLTNNVTAKMLLVNLFMIIPLPSDDFISPQNSE
jgi:hypothetical protein